MMLICGLVVCLNHRRQMQLSARHSPTSLPISSPNSVRVTITSMNTARTSIPVLSHPPNCMRSRRQRWLDSSVIIRITFNGSHRKHCCSRVWLGKYIEISKWSWIYFDQSSYWLQFPSYPRNAPVACTDFAAIPVLDYTSWQEWSRLAFSGRVIKT